jgi:epoxyqueuosine reductase QueG
MNHQLIIPGIGSYIFLAEIVTRAILPPDKPCALSCNNCGACLRACPAGALSRQSLSEPSSFKSGLCNSYLTIEHRGEFPYTPKLSPNRIYGCDLCLEACPLAAPTAAPAASSAGSLSSSAASSSSSSLPSFNSALPSPSAASVASSAAAYSAGSGSSSSLSPSSAAVFAAKAQALPEFEPREALLKLTKADILALTQEGFSLLFRHSPIKRAKLLGLLRNARAL